MRERGYASLVPSIPVPAYFSPPIHFFHIRTPAIFVMWEGVLDVVTDVFHGIVPVPLEA